MRVEASDANKLTVGALTLGQSQFRFDLSTLDEGYYYRVKQAEALGDGIRGAVAFGLSFGGKEWGGVARPVAKYAAAWNRWADRFGALTNVRVALAEYQTLVCEPESIIYCDPPYDGTTGYKTGRFDTQAFWAWCKRIAAEGHKVFVSSEHTPFRLVAEFSRNRNTNGNSSGRIDRLWRV